MGSALYKGYVQLTKPGGVCYVKPSAVIYIGDVRSLESGPHKGVEVRAIGLIHGADFDILDTPDNMGKLGL